MSSSHVRNNPQESRFELDTDAEVAIAAYELRGEEIAFTHTIVPEALEGRGIGGALIKGALEHARERGLKVVPLCSFVRHYMDAHPETQDLL